MNIQISVEQVIAWATLAISIVGAYFKLSARFTGKYVELMTRITAIETKIDIFWKDVSYDAAKIIHHPGPGHERLDLLIDRYTREELQEADVHELMHLLQQKIDNHNDSKSERLTASVLLRAIQQRFRVFLKTENDAP